MHNLDHLGYLVPVRRNELIKPVQIWHTGSQGSGTPSCKT